MSFDYSELIKIKKKGDLTINIYKAGYYEGSYFFIVAWGKEGIFEEKRFNKLNDAKRFFDRK